MTMSALSEKDWGEFILSDDGDYWIDIASALESAETDGKLKYTFKVDGRCVTRELTPQERIRLISSSEYAMRYYKACRRKLKYESLSSLISEVKKLIAGLREGSVNQLGSSMVAAEGATVAIQRFQKFIDKALSDSDLTPDVIGKLFSKKAPGSRYSFGDYWFSLTLYPDWLASVRAKLKQRLVAGLRDAFNATGFMDVDACLKDILAYQEEKVVEAKERQADGSIKKTIKTIKVKPMEVCLQVLAEDILRNPDLGLCLKRITLACDLGNLILKILEKKIQPLPDVVGLSPILDSIKIALEFARQIEVDAKTHLINQFASKAQVIKAVGGLGVMCVAIAANNFERVLSCLEREREKREAKELQRHVDHIKACLRVYLELPKLSKLKDFLVLLKRESLSVQDEICERYLDDVGLSVESIDHQQFIDLINKGLGWELLLVYSKLGEKRVESIVKTEAELSAILHALFPKGRDLSKVGFPLLEAFYKFQVMAYLSIRTQESSKKEILSTLFATSGHSKAEKINAAKKLLAWFRGTLLYYSDAGGGSSRALRDLRSSTPALRNGRLGEIVKEIDDSILSKELDTFYDLRSSLQWFFGIESVDEVHPVPPQPVPPQHMLRRAEYYCILLNIESAHMGDLSPYDVFKRYSLAKAILRALEKHEPDFEEGSLLVSPAI